MVDAAVELADAEKPFETDRSTLLDGLAGFSNGSKKHYQQ